MKSIITLVMTEIVLTHDSLFSRKARFWILMAHVTTSFLYIDLGKQGFIYETLKEKKCQGLFSATTLKAVYLSFKCQQSLTHGV